MSEPRLCRLCGTGIVPPASLKRYDYRCSRCRYRSQGYQRSWRQYTASPSYRRRKRLTNVRRIRARGGYYGLARTADDAAALTAHIRRRVCEFREGQRAEEP